MATAPAPKPPSFSPLSSSSPQPTTTLPSPPPSLSPPPSPSKPPLHPDITFWKERVKDWYPRWKEAKYFVPPVQLNRVFHHSQTVLGQEVEVCQSPDPAPPSDAASAPTVNSDVREDQTQQHVLHYLHRLFDISAVAILVLSQLRYEDYLSEPSFHAAAQTLPRSVDLKKEGKDRGDFDVLIIHSLYGIAQCEIKSVGDLFPKQLLTTDQQDSIVSSRVKRAVTQLQKGRDVLRHLVSDVAHPPRVHSTLMLPHIPRHQLQRVLEARPELRQSLCDCLGTEDMEDTLKLCVTSDMLPPVSRPYDVTDEVIKHLADWWATLVTTRGEDPAMSEDLYLELFARFAGPATTMRISQNSAPRLQPSGVRTGGQGVAEVGDRFTQIMLTPRQVSVLQEDLPLVFLTGPPGTGKTVALVLKGQEWLRAGGEVHVCSTWYKSLAASFSIVQQLQQLVGEAEESRVVLHKFVLSRRGEEKLQEAAASLTTTVAKSAGLNVIADEAYFDCDALFSDFCDLLFKHFQGGLRVWAASLNHAARPDLLTEVTLTEPLRTPPAVTREVAQCERMKDGTVYEYTAPASTLPSDGPQPFFLYHEGEGHSENVNGPLMCQQCGRQLAQVLLTDLGVGVPVPSPHKESPSSQPALRFSDVVILISRQPHGRSLSEDVGVVEGLKEGGLPVRVVKRRDWRAVQNVARMEAGESIVLAEQSDVYGLERKVVAWLQTERSLTSGSGGGRQSRAERWGRLYAMSRSSAQLLCVLWPATRSAETEGAGVFREEGAGVLSKEGAGVLSEEGAGVLSEEGAGVLSEEGVGVFREEGAGVLSEEGVGALSEEGAGVLSEEGAGVLSEEGAGVLSEEGAGVLSEEGAGVLSEEGAGVLSEEGAGALSEEGQVR